MKFALLVTQAPFAGSASASALAFAEAALARGHEIFRIFFYGEGVLNADRLADPQAGHRHLVRDWAALGQRGVDLVVCINAGRRRGLREANLAPGFRISGLGQMTEAVMTADRTITFGG